MGPRVLTDHPQFLQRIAARTGTPGVEPGSLLAIGGAGAYGFTMASSYNSRPRPAEVLVDGDRWAVIRERETVSDLMRGERSLSDVMRAGAWTQ